MTAMALLCAALGVASSIRTFEDVRGTPYEVSVARGSSLLINDEPSLFLSGSIHYPRIPVSEWDRILAEAKTHGLTMISVYIFWNFHEPSRGHYDFSTGARNLPLFLKKAADHGLFVYLRPGPYVCAEWDYGGLPVWLHDIPGMRFRTYTAAWMAEAERWLHKVMEVAEPFLARHGGPVMIGQIENELWPGQYFPDGEQARYTEWMGAVAHNMSTKGDDAGIPWTMCNGASANSTLNTFNGNDAVKEWFFRQDGYGHQFPNGPHAKQPMIWTEDEMWFDSWPAAAPLIGRIDASQTSFAIARFFARGAVLHNFYMWVGGNNFGITAGANVLTAYADDAPLHADGLRNEPSFSHLQKLHMVLHNLSDVISSAPAQIGKGVNCTDPSTNSLSDVVYFSYAKQEGQAPISPAAAVSEVLFVENANETESRKVFCAGHSFTLSPASLLIATVEAGAGAAVVFQSDVIGPIITHPSSSSSAARAPQPSPAYPTRVYTPLHDSPLRWTVHREPLPLSEAVTKIITSAHPLEQLGLTHDASAYCYYQTRFAAADLAVARAHGEPHGERERVLPLLIEGRTNNAYVVALDGVVVAQLEHHQSGTLGPVNLTANVSISAAIDAAGTAGAASHTLTVLSSSLGLRNDGIFDDAREAKGVAELCLGNLNLTAATRSALPGGSWLHHPGLQLTPELAELQGHGQGQGQEQMQGRFSSSISASASVRERVGVGAANDSAANVSLVWLHTSFNVPASLLQRNGRRTDAGVGALVLALDATGLGRGHAFVNGFDVGMYWPQVPTREHGVLTAQRYYYIPVERLNPVLAGSSASTNSLVLFEEVGAPRPDLARITRVELR